MAYQYIHTGHLCIKEFIFKIDWINISVAIGFIYCLKFIITLHDFCLCICTYFYTDVTSNYTAGEGAVRLVGGDTVLEGRVEVFLLGHWGTVCDYNWDFADATVVCHQLGYPEAVEAPRYAAFGAGSGPSWYYNVYCTGTERNLTDCSKSTSNTGSACSHSRDAGAVCSS